MKEKVKDMVTRVRVALDEIAGADVDSDFMADMDVEIEQALLTAATELSEELPAHLLMPYTDTEIKPADYEAQTGEEVISSDNVAVIIKWKGHDYDEDNGAGSLALPHDFLRLVYLRLQSWPQAVVMLTDPASNEARMQACEWTRGTPQKPVVFVGESWMSGDGTRYRVLKYYTAGKKTVERTENGTTVPVEVYDHVVYRLSYVTMPVISTDDNSSSTSSDVEPPTRYLCADLHDRAIPLIVNRACAILLDSKQNSGLADRFRAMSSIS